eukprot:CCRYP_016131-RA/>CCRYP_016131-RA protein AED:0.07 eAED:0.07 QI:308/1/1/1/0.66/0.42/7/2083/1063
MAKARSKNKSKRSIQSLPKGIPHRKSSSFTPQSTHSPFENARTSSTKVKHHVHNRKPATPSAGGGGRSAQTALAESIARRKRILSVARANEFKANEFIDRRIGEARLSREEAMLKRIVQERVRRSRKRSKFSLEDDDDMEEGGLTHGGKTIDESYKPSNTDFLSDDDDDEDLDKVDTSLHFGGGKFDSQNAKESGAYGAAGSADLGTAYRSRREELEERIQRKKMEKAEKMKRKEDQAETFETMDESFSELAKLLQFRDKEQERVERSQKKKAGTLSAEDVEMDDWDKEMKEYLFERKVKATDRTKTPEEIAKEEADRLHKLETRRLARMNGDFDEDDLSDISDDDMGRKKRGKNGKKGVDNKKRKRERGLNPEELSDSDDDEEKGGDGREVRFTSDGLVYVDKDGKVVGKVGEEQDENNEGADTDDDNSEGDTHSNTSEESSSRQDLGDSGDEASAAGSSDDESDEDAHDVTPVQLAEGVKVQGNYRASEQYGGKENWYNGVITAVRKGANGKNIYDVTYDDGDFEEGMKEEDVRPLPKSEKELEEEKAKDSEAVMAKRKKLKAKLRAKDAIPFVFEVPTTLDALHDMIATHASTGADASLIIQRIHIANSVRLNHKNKERMQNFYDVLLRRFIAVGDEIFNSGNGGPDLERYEQLNSLTKVLYAMSQDSPECAGAVWSRRLGVFQKAHAKRLRDVEVTPLGDACQGEFSAWPSTGMLFLMRALPHIFPSTDKRHAVVTPALLLLGQIIVQTPLKSQYDVVIGLFCSGLMMEYTKDAKRLAPEAMAFLSGVLRLFADDGDSALTRSPLPSFGSGNTELGFALRKTLSTMQDKNSVRFSLEKSQIQSNSCSTAILNFTLHLVKHSITVFGKTEEGSEREIFSEITKALLCIDGSNKDLPLPVTIKNAIAETARTASTTCASEDRRTPLQRRKKASAQELAIKTLAPRMEDPDRYSMSKDKGKSQMQAQHDRNRREYKREHKAVMRELRLDSAFIENERRKEKDEADGKARAQRHRNYAWMEMEQATMNQQVRLGGGLLSGGGVGAAKKKARSGKLGIKKGGKF